jgi:hypothetical protein
MVTPSAPTRKREFGAWITPFLESLGHSDRKPQRERALPDAD